MKQTVVSRSALGRLAHNFSLPTPWPAGRIASAWFVGVVALGFLLQLLPRPAGWPLGFLFAEDGQVFLTDALQLGSDSLFSAYAGYLHLLPRSIALTCSSLATPGAYVVCTGIAAALVKVVAAAIAWPVLSAYARSWAWGLAAASSFLFIPVGNLEVLGNITNLRWFLVAGAFFALLGSFRSASLALIAAGFTFAASTSDPLALAWLPLALWRIGGQRSWARLPGAAVLLGAVVQLLHLQPEARGERGTVADLVAQPLDTVAQLLIRGPVTTQYGMSWTQEFLRFGVLPTLLTLGLTALVIFAAWNNRRAFAEASRLAEALLIASFGLLLVVLSFPASYIAFTEIWSPSQPSRYSAFAALLLTPALILAMSIAWRGNSVAWHRIIVGLTGLALAVAFVTDAMGDPRHSSGPPLDQTLSQARTLCLAGQSSVDVPNVPNYEGWRTTITCSWLLR